MKESRDRLLKSHEFITKVAVIILITLLYKRYQNCPNWWHLGIIVGKMGEKHLVEFSPIN